ncbi:MAG: sigma-70 family RNA polymerase sigma factor, partial [Pirellulaceae bacterium]
MTSPDKLLVQQIRAGSEDAWQTLIDTYEGRLTAFVRRRLTQASAVEDIVQDTFIGFLTSIPNFDDSRPIQGFLFTICAFKLTDHLRREGRRPTIPINANNSSDSAMQLPGRDRKPSAIFRSEERKGIETNAIAEIIEQLIQSYKTQQDWLKISTLELLFLRGMKNKVVADKLAISQQVVASTKFEFVDKIKKQLRKQGLNKDIFPELNEQGSKEDTNHV